MDCACNITYLGFYLYAINYSTFQKHFIYFLNKNYLVKNFYFLKKKLKFIFSIRFSRVEIQKVDKKVQH